MGEHQCYSCSFVCGTYMYTSISAKEIKDQLLHQTFWLDKKGRCFFIDSDQKCTISWIYCYFKYTTRANQECAVVGIMFVAAVTSQIYYLGRHSEQYVTCTGQAQWTPNCLYVTSIFRICIFDLFMSNQMFSHVYVVLYNHNQGSH